MLKSIICDPEEIQDFRNKLRDIIDDLDDVLKKTKNKLDEVRSTGWKDEVVEDFQSKFSEDYEYIVPLREHIDEYEASVLKRYQAAVTEYLGTRF